MHEAYLSLVAVGAPVLGATLVDSVFTWHIIEQEGRLFNQLPEPYGDNVKNEVSAKIAYVKFAAVLLAAGIAHEGFENLDGKLAVFGVSLLGAYFFGGVINALRAGPFMDPRVAWGE